MGMKKWNTEELCTTVRNQQYTSELGIDWHLYSVGKEGSSGSHIEVVILGYIHLLSEFLCSFSLFSPGIPIIQKGWHKERFYMQMHILYVPSDIIGIAEFFPHFDSNYYCHTIK